MLVSCLSDVLNSNDTMSCSAPAAANTTCGGEVNICALQDKAGEVVLRLQLWVMTQERNMRISSYKNCL